MINLLIGNENIDEINLIRQRFMYDKNYNIENVNTGIAVVSTYLKIKPDILVIDSNLPDMSIENIIDKISCNPLELKKCNTVLTVAPNYQMKLNNVAKLNKIIYKPVEINNLINVIKELATFYNIPDLDDIEVDWLLQILNFNCMSPGYKYMKDAIIYCYYRPNELEFLNNVLTYLSHKYEVPETKIRDALKSSMKPYNNSNFSSCSDDFYKFVHNDNQPLPLKDFLQRIVIYLIREKKKGRIS